jgi:hypothetical protein
MKLRAFLATAIAVATVSLTASAQSGAQPLAPVQQPWLKDRRFGEGIGYRAGNLELHPGAAAEFGYDSNYFLRADDENRIDVFRLRATPSLTLSTLGQQRRLEGGGGAPPSVNFTGGVFLSYSKLFATSPSKTDPTTGQTNGDAVSNVDNVVDAGANFTLDVLPQRPWGFDMYGDYVRTAQPSNISDANFAYDRDAFRLGAGINWRPGGGLFETRLGYELDANVFEKNPYKELNNAQHYLKFRSRWRFLPRTALLYDGKIGFLRYSNATDLQHDAQVVDSRIGLNGLITHHFAALALAGWAASFYESRGAVPVRNYDGPVGQAELKWFLLPQPGLDPNQATVGLSSIALGYIRDYVNNYLSDYYRRDRGYANFSYFIAGAFLVSVEGGLSHLTYSTTFFGNGAVRQPSFGQDRPDVTFFAEYRPSDTIGINTTLRYTAALQNTRVPIVPGGATDNLQFSRYEAFLGVRWFM